VKLVLSHDVGTNFQTLKPVDETNVKLLFRF